MGDVHNPLDELQRLEEAATPGPWMHASDVAALSGETPQRCPVCEGVDWPGLTHNPHAPYCSLSEETPK